jgi:hypothetical protein
MCHSICQTNKANNKTHDGSKEENPPRSKMNISQMPKTTCHDPDDFFAIHLVATFHLSKENTPQTHDEDEKKNPKTPSPRPVSTI